MLVLTPREWEVLKLMAEGRTSTDIADALDLSDVTVKKHVQSIKAKLRASGWTNAANTGGADGPTLSRPLPLTVRTDRRLA